MILNSVLSVTDLPEAFKGTINPWTHVPVQFSNTKSLNLQVQGTDSDVWISTVSTYPNSDVSQLKTQNSSSIFSQANELNHGSVHSLISYFNSEQTDPGNTSSLSFFADGEKSGRISSRGYGDGSPDAFYLNASYLALNGVGQRIGVVYPPMEDGYWLKEIILRTVFQSELNGSGINGDEPRDFLIDIFTFKNGLPSDKLIPTTLFKAQRESGKLIKEEFSLEKFYPELSEISDSIIIVLGNDADDENFISIGMDEGVQNASLFSELGELEDWVSLAEKSIGGNSLSGWNAIIRMNAVASDAEKKQVAIITSIYNDFDKVFVELEPDQPFDSISVRVIAQLPDGSFQKGSLVPKNRDIYTFSFPVLANGEYHFQAVYKSQDGTTNFIDEEDWEIEIPDGFELGHNYPNPFNPETNLQFLLLEEANISLQIFDVIGRKVMEIPERKFTSGEHSVQIQMNGLASGMYLVRVKLNRSRNGLTTYRTQKIMLIK